MRVFVASLALAAVATTGTATAEPFKMPSFVSTGPKGGAQWYNEIGKAIMDGSQLLIMDLLADDVKVVTKDARGDYRNNVVIRDGSSTDAIGGYAVPREIDEKIEKTLVAISPIRSVANVVKVGSAGYRKLITTGGTPSGWVAYEAARPMTNTPTFSEIVPAAGELYANPAASQQMLDDAMFDVEAWLANEIATEFARAEGVAFVKGTGTNQPLGFISSPSAATADGVRPQGTLQFIGTGVSAGFPASNPQDKILDLVQSLRPPYRQGAVFVMNSATATAVRKFKTADGAYVWQPGLASGQPATLLGYPVIEAEDMPDIAASSLSVAFGNFKAGYVIAERNATSILRDPFTNKPYVHFYATKRVGGQVVNSEAIKLLKFA